MFIIVARLLFLVHSHYSFICKCDSLSSNHVILQDIFFFYQTNMLFELLSQRWFENVLKIYIKPFEIRVLIHGDINVCTIYLALEKHKLQKYGFNHAIAESKALVADICTFRWYFRHVRAHITLNYSLP